MNNLTESDLREAMLHGAFYCSYEPNGSDSKSPTYGQAMTPKVLDVSIQGTLIQIYGDYIDSYLWID